MGKTREDEGLSPYLLLSGYYGFGNCGDEAILSAFLQGLRRRLPDAEVAVLSADPAQTRALHGVSALHRYDLGAVWKALGRSDLLLSGGGNLFQDATSWRSPLYYLGIVWLARFRRCPWMVAAQGFGPLRRRLLRLLARLTLRRAAAIVLRDERSAEELRALGIRSPLSIVADPTLLLPPASGERIEQIWAKENLPAGSPRIGVAVRRPTRPDASFLPRLAEGLKRAVEALGAKLVFLPFQFPEDFDLSLSLATLIQTESGLLSHPCRPEEMLGLIGDCDLLLGMRLHSLIFAARTGVPMVALSYDPKVDAFGESILAPAGLKLDASPEVIAARIIATFQQRQAWRSQLHERLPQLQASAAETFSLVSQVLARKRRNRD